MILLPLFAVVLKRLGFSPKLTSKRTAIVVVGALVFPPVLINAGLTALVWNGFGLRHMVNARPLGRRGCITFGWLLLLLEWVIVSIL